MFGHKITNFLENRGIFGGNYQNLIKKYFSETTLNHFNINNLGIGTL